MHQRGKNVFVFFSVNLTSHCDIVHGLNFDVPGVCVFVEMAASLHLRETATLPGPDGRNSW